MKKSAVFATALCGFVCLASFADGYSSANKRRPAVSGASVFERLSANGPFFYSAEKGGQRLLMLGTIHLGVSLEGLSCSKQIKAQILASDSVFVENQLAAISSKYGIFLALLSGSEEEKAKTLSELSPEKRALVQDLFRETQSSNRRILSMAFSESGGGEFEDLSRTARDFLISYGADRRWSYLGCFSYLSAKTEYEFNSRLSSKGELDAEIAALAEAGEIDLKTLEDYSFSLQSFERAYKEGFLKEMGLLADEDRVIVDRGFIEMFIEQNFMGEGGEKRQKEQEAALKTVSEAYKSGDRQKMLSFASGAASISTVSSRYFLGRRNRLWLKKLKAEMESGKTVFAAAGLGHFIEADNLLDMLKEEGFLIRRMGKDCSSMSEILSGGGSMPL